MIPDAAVEAAAEWLPHSGDCEVRPERDCTCWKPRVNLMRAALEAAAPIIRAEVLEAAADEGWQAVIEYSEQTNQVTPVGYLHNWLRARAAAERLKP